jgi:hypothetical protein
MKHLHFGWLFALMWLPAVEAAGQSATDCASLMKFGVYDKYRTFTTESHYKQIKEFFENNQFSSRQQAQAKATELGVDLAGILAVSFGGSSSGSSFEHWRQHLLRSSYQEAMSVGLSASTIEVISGKLTSLVEGCLRQRGVHAYVIPAADNQNFTVTVDFVPVSSDQPYTQGTLTLTPSSVASQCSPNGVLGRSIQIGAQGVSLSCRRLTTDTVTVVVNTSAGSPTFTYDAYVVPRPSVEFTATRDAIDAGETTRLSWDARNALRVSLAGFGQVQEAGSRDVAPGTTTEYVLTVTSLDGQSTSVSKRIVVIPPPPTLAGASVEFYTTNDNKDHDTTASVFVRCGGTLVATVSGTWGEFRDNTPSGWKELTMVERPKKAAVLGVCMAQAHEDPKGDDEWHFNWALRLRFSDGSTASYRWNGENLAEDRRDTSPKPL